MTEPTENTERLFQQLDDLVAEIIDRYGGQGYGPGMVIETLQDALAKRQHSYARKLEPNHSPGDSKAGDFPRDH